jgi:predicted transcriptional regulator
VKRLQAFAMFAAEYRKFEREREADDYLMSDQTFKRIRRVFEESAALISNSIVPDSFIWRLWYYIERHNRRTITEMDKVNLIFLYTNSIILGLSTRYGSVPLFETIVYRRYKKSAYTCIQTGGNSKSH